MEFELKIPESILLALRLPDEEKESRLLRELAVSLYERGLLSFGKARELAKLSKWEFHEELQRRDVKRHYNIEDLEEDLAYGNKEF